MRFPAYMVCDVAVSVLGIVINAVVLAAVLRQRALRANIKLLLVMSLATADLLVSLTSLLKAILWTYQLPEDFDACTAVSISNYPPVKRLVLLSPAHRPGPLPGHPLPILPPHVGYPAARASDKGVSVDAVATAVCCAFHGLAQGPGILRRQMPPHQSHRSVIHCLPHLLRR